MIIAMVWVLGLQLEYGGEVYTARYPTDTQCVDVGKKLHKAAVERARKLKKPPPPGWACIEDVGTAVRT